MSGQEEFDYPEVQPIAYVLLDPAGKTANQTVLARHAPLRRQQGQPSAFAPERHGNDVKHFITGEKYFEDVCKAIQAARQSVFIAGWQVNWATKLMGNTRLIDALKTAVDQGAKVYVMPWQSPKVGVDTGDLGTMLAVFQLNCGKKNLQAFCCPAGLQNDHRGVEETFFSHHQKLVVVDGKIAYVGGIDLAFGRRDDESFSLAHGWRSGPEVYNTGVPARHKLLPGEATAYVDEVELLQATLAVGPLETVLNSSTRATNAAGQSALGRKVDAGVDWWRRPIDVNQLPRFLREGVKWAGEAADAATQSARRSFDEAAQESADALIRQLDAGLISPAKVTALIDTARAAVRTSYNALLGMSWIDKQPQAELFNPASQSTPTDNATHGADQPRMPWQDVQVRIEGPSVYDLAQNFIRRWNSVQKSYLLGPLERHTRIGAELCPPRPAEGKGNGGTGKVAVRVLRSAPLTLQRDEAKATPGTPPPIDKQQEIHDAMVAAIRHAERFIYIENQFFQSGFGEASARENEPAERSGPMSYLMSQPSNRIKAALTRVSAPNVHLAPRNCISRAIADRIERAIQWGHAFHAYLVLPVHPEGRLDDPAIVGQIHWTMQSLVHASDSLVNRVRLALYARQVCKQPRDQGEWEAAKRKGLEADPKNFEMRVFESAVKKSATNDYLTLLNLRTCQTIAGKVRTEQVYVHSKLLIVDDRFVIVGSANINDRSLAGGRDSELAVLLMDTATQTAPMDGKNPLHVRTLAHELRVKLWKKHFGLLGHPDLVQPAKSLESLVDKPAHPATWQAIQAIAKRNAEAYAKAFKWVPRDGASIWPVWDPKKKFRDNAPNNKSNIDRKQIQAEVEPFAQQMPFSEEFWKSPPVSAAPVGIQGFICALPMEWTLGENNHPDMSMVILTNKTAGGEDDTYIVRGENPQNRSEV